jgi:Flp pilus assembly protein TadD
VNGPDDFLALDAALSADLARIGHEFQAEFLERARPSRPDDIGLLGDLAHALTRIGRHAEGLAVDRRIVELAPVDPTARYNLACSLSLTGAIDEALEELLRARECGWNDIGLAHTDPDLEAARTSPRFVELFGPTPEQK